MSSGEIEDDSINTQIKMQIHAFSRDGAASRGQVTQTRLQKRNSIHLKLSRVTWQQGEKILKTIFINSQKYRGYDHDIQLGQTSHFAKWKVINMKSSRLSGAPEKLDRQIPFLQRHKTADLYERKSFRKVTNLWRMRGGESRWKCRRSRVGSQPSASSSLPFKCWWRPSPAAELGKVESSPRLSLLSPNMDVINWPSNAAHQFYQQSTQGGKQI